MFHPSILATEVDEDPPTQFKPSSGEEILALPI